MRIRKQPSSSPPLITTQTMITKHRKVVIRTSPGCRLSSFVRRMTKDPRDKRAYTQYKYARIIYRKTYNIVFITIIVIYLRINCIIVIVFLLFIFCPTTFGWTIIRFLRPRIRPGSVILSWYGRAGLGFSGAFTFSILFLFRD